MSQNRLQQCRFCSSVIIMLQMPAKEGRKSNWMPFQDAGPATFTSPIETLGRPYAVIPLLRDGFCRAGAWLEPQQREVSVLIPHNCRNTQ